MIVGDPDCDCGEVTGGTQEKGVTGGTDTSVDGGDTGGSVTDGECPELSPGAYDCKTPIVTVERSPRNGHWRNEYRRR